jgi:hypothetical protein
MTINTEQIVDKVSSKVSKLGISTNRAQFLEDLEHALATAGVSGIIDGSSKEMLESWQPLPTGWDEDTLLDLGLQEGRDYIERQQLRKLLKIAPKKIAPTPTQINVPDTRITSTEEEDGEGNHAEDDDETPGNNNQEEPLSPGTPVNSNEMDVDREIPKKFLIRYKHIMDRSKYVEEMTKEKACRLAIEGCLGETWKTKVQESLGTKRSAVQVYEFIRNTLSQPDAVEISEREKNLFSLQLDEDGDAETYLKESLLKIKEGRLLKLQTALNHPERILISGLPSSYNTEIRNIESQGKGIRVSEIIKIIEARTKLSGVKRKAPEDALSTDFTTPPPPPKVPKLPGTDNAGNQCHFCSRKGHFQQGCFINPKSSKFMIDRARRLVQRLPHSEIAKKIVSQCPNILQGPQQSQEHEEAPLMQTFLTADEFKKLNEIRRKK